ncbi:hypothetical protein J6590_004350 [Homalodisca vitripennis]|nr:hypothetical protein J6590_004350 [Homalodisca vitripennis]
MLQWVGHTTISASTHWSTIPTVYGLRFRSKLPTYLFGTGNKSWRLDTEVVSQNSSERSFTLDRSPNFQHGLSLNQQHGLESMAEWKDTTKEVKLSVFHILCVIILSTDLRKVY